MGRRTLGETQPKRCYLGTGSYEAGRKELVLETRALALIKLHGQFTGHLTVETCLCYSDFGV